MQCLGKVHDETNISFFAGFFASAEKMTITPPQKKTIADDVNVLLQKSTGCHWQVKVQRILFRLLYRAVQHYMYVTSVEGTMSRILAKF